MLDLKLTLGYALFISYTIVSVFTRNFLKKMGLVSHDMRFTMRKNLKPKITKSGIPCDACSISGCECIQAIL